MPPISSPSGLALPNGFPDGLFEVVKDRVVPKVQNPSPALDNLCGGHNGVRYRLRACVEYSEEFIACVRRVGDAPQMEDRYRQERQLFGFFLSGITALDSFNFFVYFAAAHLKPTAFPIQKPGHIKAISRKTTAESFGREFTGEPLTIALNSLINDSALKEWDGFRNVLAHRAVPGRVVYASFGSSAPVPAADWKIDPAGSLKIELNLTPPRLQWLVGTLADLVAAADPFTRKYF